MDIYVVTDGDWDDKAYYLVLGATSEQDAIDQVAAYRKKQYDSTLWGPKDLEGPTTAELITSKKGVTKL